MDILYELSYLLFQDTENLSGKSRAYRTLRSIEGRLLEELTEKAGEDLVEKLIDIRTETAYHDLLRCFLYGLQLGRAVSELGQSS